MWEAFRSFQPRDALDVAIVAYVFYRLVLAFRGTLAVQVLVGVALVMLGRFVSTKANLQGLGFIFDSFWAYWVLGLVILFQPELRRVLARTGQSRALRRMLGQGGAAPHLVVEEIVGAAESLSAKRIGALIVVERSTGLGHYAELGVPVDGVLTAELLGSLFLPASPLHDGAVFVRNGRIAVAGCFLPLSRNLRLSRTLGTRHRAAVGITEETDAVAVVVSEETGRISLAVEGAMESPLDAAALGERLGNLLGLDSAEPRGSLLSGLRRLSARSKA